MIKTALYKEHKKLNAKLVDFAGFSMPISYSGIIEEVKAVRQKAGIFDISHMGMLKIDKKNLNIDFENKHLAYKISHLATYKVKYNRILNNQRGIIDDILVYIFDDKYIWIVNASNIEKVKTFLTKNNIIFQHETKLPAIALQGPQSEKILQNLFSFDDLKYYHFKEFFFDNHYIMVSRTGYTGENGFELYSKEIILLWQKLIELGAIPSGLGARDVLRLEAGMPLYGNELNEEITEEQSKKILGFEIANKKIARKGYKILDLDTEVGYITSGTFSPTLEKAIAMGYLTKNVSNNLAVVIREKKAPLKIAKLPFYKKPNS